MKNRKDYGAHEKVIEKHEKYSQILKIQRALHKLFKD